MYKERVKQKKFHANTHIIIINNNIYINGLKYKLHTQLPHRYYARALMHYFLVIITTLYIYLFISFLLINFLIKFHLV